MFYLLFPSLLLVLCLDFRVVVLTIDSIEHSHLLLPLQSLSIKLCLFSRLSLLVVMPVSPGDDIVVSRLFWVQIALVVVLLSEADLLEVSLIVVPAIDDVVALEGGIPVLFLPHLPGQAQAAIGQDGVLTEGDNVVIGGVLVLVALDGRGGTRCLICSLARCSSSCSIVRDSSRLSRKDCRTGLNLSSLSRTSMVERRSIAGTALPKGRLVRFAFSQLWSESFHSCTSCLESPSSIDPQQNYGNRMVISKKLDHFHLRLWVSLSEPLDEDLPAFLLLLLGLFLVKGVAAQSQVPHDLVVEAAEVEAGEGEHEYGEDDHDLGTQGDLSEEAQEGSWGQSCDLEVVVAERVAHSGQVYGGEEQTARGGVPPMQGEDLIDPHAEDGVRYDIPHIGCEEGVGQECHSSAAVAHEHCQHIGGGEELGEGGQFCEEDEAGEGGGDEEEEGVVDVSVAIAVGLVGEGGALEVVYQLVQLALHGLFLEDALLDDLVQVCRRFLPLAVSILIPEHAVELEVLCDKGQDNPLLSGIPIIRHSIQFLLHRPDFLEDGLLFGLDRLCLPVAKGDQSLVIPPKKAFLGEGDQSESQQDRDEGQPEDVDEGGEDGGQLDEGELARRQEVDHDADRAQADDSHQNPVHHQGFLHPPSSRKLPRIFVLLREREHQPAEEEVDVVDGGPGCLHLREVLAAREGGLVDVDGEEGEAEQGAEDAREDEGLGVEGGFAVGVVEDEEAGEQGRGRELDDVDGLHILQRCNKGRWVDHNVLFSLSRWQFIYWIGCSNGILQVFSQLILSIEYDKSFSGTADPHLNVSL